jgi:aspartyl/asparaginyl-tRNA synthetase
MFEFESKGGFEELKQVEKELLEYLGFRTPLEVTYEDMCRKYSTDIVEAEHETKMWSNLGTSVSLQKFPKRTSPFFNMKSEDGETFEKIDVILFGMETIGSAVRSSDPTMMRKMFYEISDGEYAGKLFELFGKERVEKELEEFLSNKFFDRFGAGIGITRLMRAYQLLKQ